MARGNEKNLIRNSDRTPEELRAMTSKGGIASGVARKRYKSMRECAKACLQMQLLDEDAIKGELAKRGLETTGGQAVVLAQLIKANQGDTDAAKFVRDTAGEKPREGLEIGNLDGKPLESIDLSALTDEQLKALAEARKAE